MGKVFGTGGEIHGLDVSRSPTRIGPHSLTKSEGCWTDQEGVVLPAPGPTQLYTGSDIKAMCAGRMGGTDHIVWLDGNTLYDNGSSAGTVPAGSTMKIIAVDDKFLILGSSDNINYVYDGNHVRMHGAWNPQARGGVSPGVDVKVSTATQSSNITSISKEDGAEVVFATGSHATIYSVGDSLYIDDGGDMTEINGKAYLVTAVDTGANSVTINVDSTNYTTYTSGGAGYHNASGLSGNYTYYYTMLLKLSDDTVLEGRPRKCVGAFPDDMVSSQERFYDGPAQTITLTPLNEVRIYLTEYWENSGLSSFVDNSVSGTAGTDYYPGFRLYRTKAGGYDFYKVGEWYYDGTTPTATDGGVERATGATYVSYNVVGSDGSDDYWRDIARDGLLRAAYVSGESDRDTPPRSSLAAFMGERLWVNDADDPSLLYYAYRHPETGNNIDYFGTFGFLPMGDDITGMAAVGRSLVVFSADRMWRVTMYGGVPQVDEIETAVGTDWGDAMDVFDLGLLFLRDDGLWSTDGQTPPVKVSRSAFSGVTTPRAVAAYGDTVYVTGAANGYVMRRRNGGLYWHSADSGYSHVSATNGVIYAATSTKIYSLFTGDRDRAAIETAHFTDFRERTARTVYVDIEGDPAPIVYVNGNRVSDYDGHAEGHAVGFDYESARRVAKFEVGDPNYGGVPARNHVFWVRVEFAPSAKVYDVYLECD